MFPMIVFQFVYDFVDYKGRNVIVKKKKKKYKAQSAE